jgi:hypothetical protein
MLLLFRNRGRGRGLVLTMHWWPLRCQTTIWLLTTKREKSNISVVVVVVLVLLMCFLVFQKGTCVGVRVRVAEDWTC